MIEEKIKPEKSYNYFSKKNIPLNPKLLNKYHNYTEIMNLKHLNIKTITCTNIKELTHIKFDILSKTELYHLASSIFDKYHKDKIFINDNNFINVSNTDIKESINKITTNIKQIIFLKEHIQIFSNLGFIIENASLVSQRFESKNRKDNNIWSYYLIYLVIDNEKYLFEFDVISRTNGENHYRVQRLQKTDASAGNTINSITPTLETSVSKINNTTNI